MDLSAASALVTGGASGLGAATVRRLARRARSVVIADLAEEAGAALADATGARFVHTDVADSEAVARAIAEAESVAPLRAVVCCAGVGWAARTVDRAGSAHPPDLFERVVAVNLFGTFHVARLAAAAMLRHPVLPSGDRGVMVFTSSIAAFDGQKGQVAYTASKAAVAAMVLPMARDLGSQQIRVNAIAPGTFDTPMFQGLRPEQIDAITADIPHPRRLGGPDEFAGAVEALLDNPYLNGTVVRLDGGLRLG